MSVLGCLSASTAGHRQLRGAHRKTGAGSLLLQACDCSLAVELGLVSGDVSPTCAFKCFASVVNHVNYLVFVQLLPPHVFRGVGQDSPIVPLAPESLTEAETRENLLGDAPQAAPLIGFDSSEPV